MSIFRNGIMFLSLYGLCFFVKFLFIMLVFFNSSQSSNFYDGYERLTLILDEMTKV